MNFQKHTEAIVQGTVKKELKETRAKIKSRMETSNYISHLKSNTEAGLSAAQVLNNRKI